MLRASFLLFSLHLGAAMGESLFSRDTFFCRGGGDDNTLTGPCSIKVGNGICLAAKDDWYPMCVSDQPELEAISMKDCQKLAAGKSDAKGWTYGSYYNLGANDTYVNCAIYVDGTNVEVQEDYTCPDGGLTWEKEFEAGFTIGTGPIQAVDQGWTEYPCYTCAPTYTPPAPPLTTRTCRLFAPGACRDAEEREYPSCSKPMSEELCKTRAAQNSQVIGYTYARSCVLHYDAETSYSCPDGYAPDASEPPRSGSGPIEMTTSIGGVSECYVCGDLK